MKIRSLLQLIRADHGLMYVIVIVLLSLIFGKLDLYVLIACVSVFLCCSSVFALNDYCDYYIDLENKRYDRPLVRGEIKRKDALYVAIITSVIALVIAVIISLEGFFILLFLTLFGYVYNLKLKQYGIVGNMYVAFSVASVFPFTSYFLIGKITYKIIFIFIVSFILVTAREIMKGVEDVRGDKHSGVKTIAVLYGCNTACLISSIMFIISVILICLPIIYFGYINYLILTLIPNILLILVSVDLLKHCNSNRIKLHRRITLLCFLLYIMILF